jgi:hypothetical protein
MQHHIICLSESAGKVTRNLPVQVLYITYAQMLTDRLIHVLTEYGVTVFCSLETLYYRHPKCVNSLSVCNHTNCLFGIFIFLTIFYHKFLS